METKAGEKAKGARGKNERAAEEGKRSMSGGREVILHVR